MEKIFSNKLPGYVTCNKNLYILLTNTYSDNCVNITYSQFSSSKGYRYNNDDLFDESFDLKPEKRNLAIETSKGELRSGYNENFTNAEDVIEYVLSKLNDLKAVEYKGHIPKENTQYIYMLDTAWKGYKEEEVPLHSIVTPKYNGQDGKRYVFDYNEKTYNVHYEWAFVENTEENKKLIEIYDKKNIELKNLQKEIKKIRNSMSGLKF